jgi:hypothetical protein
LATGGLETHDQIAPGKLGAGEARQRAQGKREEQSGFLHD